MRRMQRKKLQAKEGRQAGEKLLFWIFALFCLAGAFEMYSCFTLGSLEELVQMGIFEVLLMMAGTLVPVFPPLGALLLGACFALAYTTNHLQTTLFHWPFWVQAVAAALLFIGGSLLWRSRRGGRAGKPLALAGRARGRIGAAPGPKGPAEASPEKGREEGGSFFRVLFFLVVALSLLCLLGWWHFYQKDALREGAARRTLWAVPREYDRGEVKSPGRVEEVTYETRAYATDGRRVQKRALVYLPAGYDGMTPMNILYLLHGTGDDEEYWLRKNPYNKTMLDQMIERGDLSPLIVVTPTFYVEEDCMENLDQLTYSFREELREDLMVAVEGRYATYAGGTEKEDFQGSRDHRAFAGLSRGAVTTLHSVLCGSLDYFSYFGTFSGSRTSGEYFQSTLQSQAFRDLPIHYLYVASGTLDFALPGQLRDYQELMDLEGRLRYGVNTSFDLFPMRYHSMGNWHLALFNFLQKIFQTV